MVSELPFSITFVHYGFVIRFIFALGGGTIRGSKILSRLVLLAFFSIRRESHHTFSKVFLKKLSKS